MQEANVYVTVFVGSEMDGFIFLSVPKVLL